MADLIRRDNKVVESSNEFAVNPDKRLRVSCSTALYSADAIALVKPNKLIVKDKAKESGVGRERLVWTEHAAFEPQRHRLNEMIDNRAQSKTLQDTDNRSRQDAVLEILSGCFKLGYGLLARRYPLLDVWRPDNDQI